MLAANKCDDAGAAANVAKLQEALRLANGSDAEELGEGAVQAVVPLSARLECELQKLAKDGAISYTPLHTFKEEGAAVAEAAGKKPLVIVSDGSAPALTSKQGAATLASAKLFGLTDAADAGEGGDDGVCFGSTGVREVLACAMRLRPPVLVWPVVDLQTGESYSINSEEPRSAVKICRDVLVLKPGTTVLALFGKRRTSVSTPLI